MTNEVGNAKILSFKEFSEDSLTILLFTNVTNVQYVYYCCKLFKTALVLMLI